MWLITWGIITESVQWISFEAISFVQNVLWSHLNTCSFGQVSNQVAGGQCGKIIQLQDKNFSYCSRQTSEQRKKKVTLVTLGMAWILVLVWVTPGIFTTPQTLEFTQKGDEQKVAVLQGEASCWSERSDWLELTWRRTQITTQESISKPITHWNLRWTWATRAEDHNGFHSCQLWTGIWGYGARRFTLIWQW